MTDRPPMSPEDVWMTTQWRNGAEQWIREQLNAAGWTITGQVEQPRIRFWSAQLRVPTDRGTVWFKENCPGQRFEARLVATMALFAPDHVVPPLAVDADRGWLLSPDQGPTLLELSDHGIDVWCRVLAALADLQRRLAPHADDLVAAGLPGMLPADVRTHLMARVDALTVLPTSHPAHLAPDAARALTRDADELGDLGDALAQGPIPMSIDPNDVHHNNVFVSGDRVRFFDFGDSCLGHPFGSLLVALRVLWDESTGTIRQNEVARARDAYLEVWSDLAPRPELLAIASAAVRLACLTRAESWRRTLAGAGPQAHADHGGAEAVWLQMHREPLAG